MKRDFSAFKSANIPTHVGIIMDGNGRWAKARLLPRSAGHKAGMVRIEGLLQHAFALGVKTVTLYALSTENLFRPKEEVEGLFQLFREFFKKYTKNILEKKVRFCVLGDREGLPADVRELLKKVEQESAVFVDRRVNIAINYGSRAEIVRAVNLAVNAGKEVSEEDFSSLLYTKGQPDVDFIIRTGGEKRLSNFLLYQAAYSELYFSDKMFPDFSNEDLDAALKDYARRARRFGKV